MKTALIILAIIVAGIVLAIYCCVAESSRQSRLEELATAPGEPADPCDPCPRWSECNGIDRENCPLCRANENKEE